MVFYGVSPFGDERDDLRNGISCSLLANINRDKNAKPYHPTDFMPYAQKEPEPDINEKVRKALSHLRKTDG